MSDTSDITAIYQTETASAICIREDESGPDVWLPLSQIEIEQANEALPLERGSIITVSAPEWLLMREGLI